MIVLPVIVVLAALSPLGQSMTVRDKDTKETVDHKANEHGAKHKQLSRTKRQAYYGCQDYAPNGCYGFVRCNANGQPSYFQCAPGTVFDPVSHICNYGTCSNGVAYVVS